MYTFKILKDTDIHTIHSAFTEAFSDYQVNSRLPFETFENMLKRRGFASDYSIGAFTESEDELVGFILNGLRSWRGVLTVYDLGTGVVPSHRKKGISRSLFQHVLKVMEQNNVNQYLLEVLQDNTAAFELYKSMGLTITRNYSCFRLDRSSYIPRAAKYKVDNLSGINDTEWEHLKQFWDFEPSWQNSIDSVGALEQEFAYSAIHIGNTIAGYGIVDKKTGDIPQIGVHREYRRRGIAADILQALLERTEADRLQMINIDSSCEDMKLFLQKSGFQPTVQQYEMMKIGL